MAKYIHLHAHEVGPRDCAFKQCCRATPDACGCTRRAEFKQSDAELKPRDQLSVCVRGAGFKIWQPDTGNYLKNTATDYGLSVPVWDE